MQTGIGLALRRVNRRIRAFSGHIVRLGHDLISHAVIACLWLVTPFVRVRVTNIRADRVGHFVPEMDLALALLHDGIAEGKSRSLNIFIFPTSTCNGVLVNLYGEALSRWRNVKVLHSTQSQLARLLTSPAQRLERGASTGGSRRFYCGSPVTGGLDQCGWTRHERPYVHLDAQQIAEAEEAVSATGLLPSHALACIHVRDRAYLTEQFTYRDWSYHDWRNPPLETYLRTIEELLEGGYFVVRTGRSAEMPLRVDHDHFLDYPFWPGKCDLLDVYLYSRASICISGGPSGIDQLGTMFNRPTAVTNLTPLEDLRYALANVVVSPTLLRERRSGRLLGLPEMIANRFGRTSDYSEAGLEIVSNTDEEIWETVDETIMRGRGLWTETTEDAELQNAFWDSAVSLGIEKPWSPDDPWSADFFRSRISARFLRRHQSLLIP